MKKLILVMTGLCVSSMALAEPQFGVKCTEYQGTSANPKKSVTLYRGPVPSLGTVTLASELAPGHHYYLTASAPGCIGTHWDAQKQIVMVPVPAPILPGQGQGQDNGKTPIPTEEPVEVFSLIETGKDLPPEAPSQGQGKVEAPIQCDTSIVDLLLKRENASKKSHSSHSVINPDGQADLKVKYKEDFWTKKVKAECHVEYLSR